MPDALAAPLYATCRTIVSFSNALSVVSFQVARTEYGEAEPMSSRTELNTTPALPPSPATNDSHNSMPAPGKVEGGSTSSKIGAAVAPYSVIAQARELTVCPAGSSLNWHTLILRCSKRQLLQHAKTWAGTWAHTPDATVPRTVGVGSVALPSASSTHTTRHATRIVFPTLSHSPLPANNASVFSQEKRDLPSRGDEAHLVDDGCGTTGPRPR
jgi:hypothetical protein